MCKHTEQRLTFQYTFFWKKQGYLGDLSKTKNIPESTFVVTQGEVEVAGDGCSQGEKEAVATQRFIFIHCADGLDHLRQKQPPQGNRG